MKALSVFASRYNKAGYYVSRVYCDWEFKPLLTDAWEQLEIDINYTNTEDHVGEAERNNRFLKKDSEPNSIFSPTRLCPEL